MRIFAISKLKPFLIAASFAVATLLLTQNCSDINLVPRPEQEKSACIAPEYVITTDNSGAQNVVFYISDLHSQDQSVNQDFTWDISYRGTSISSAFAPELSLAKSRLTACQTYQVSATYMACDMPQRLEVPYTPDDNNCVSTTPTPTPTPIPEYPTPAPAPPGQQTTGMGCQHSTGAPLSNPNFDYAHAKYCFADINFNASPAAHTQYWNCLNSGVDISGDRQYYPIIRPNQYTAMEVVIPRTSSYRPNRFLCGFYIDGESGSQCGGTPGPLEISVSANPGDFSSSDPICHVGNLIANQISTGLANSAMAVHRCPLDPGRKYYINMRAPNCTNPNGCTNLIWFRALYSDHADCSNIVPPS